MTRKRQLFIFLGMALALFAVLAWTQGSGTGFFSQPERVTAANPKDEACTEKPCGKFDKSDPKDKDKDKNKDNVKDTPCDDDSTCGTLINTVSETARGAAAGPCNGPCATLDPGLEPCDGPCGPVASEKEPCNGPCRELEVPRSTPGGPSGLDVPPGLRKGH